MEVVDRIYKLQTGFLSPHKYSQQLQYRLTSKISREADESFLVPNNAEILDFDLQDNWLLAAHPGFNVSMYNVRKLPPKCINYPCVQQWSDRRVFIPSRLIGYPAYECVNWSRENKFFTISGSTPYVLVVDTVTCQTIERVTVPDCIEIYQHKPQPKNNAVLASACNELGVPVLDLRTGNVSLTIHTHASQSVAWSPVNEYLLASLGDEELRLWDIRMTKKSRRLKIQSIPSGSAQHSISKIVPEVQFIPGTHVAVGLSADRKLFQVDTYYNHLKYDSVFPKGGNWRFKFALVGYTTSPLIFLPLGLTIALMNLSNFEVIREFGGHVFPVSKVVYNPLKHELYSASRECNLVWIPPRPVS